MSFLCQYVIETSGGAHLCSTTATWLGEWSDRRMFVCDKHRDGVRQNRNGDNDSDRTGITWNSSDGRFEYESRESLAP